MDKYYTPDLKDLFIGYSCQLKKPNEDWYNTILDLEWGYDGNSGGFNEAMDAITRGDIYKIRTAYLSKEDIESIGFETYPYTQDFRILWRKFLEDNTQVDIYLHKDQFITIYVDYEICFRGNCPSINELKKIMKLLNIK